MAAPPHTGRDLHPGLESEHRDDAGRPASRDPDRLNRMVLAAMLVALVVAVLIALL